MGPPLNKYMVKHLNASCCLKQGVPKNYLGSLLPHGPLLILNHWALEPNSAAKIKKIAFKVWLPIIKLN